LTELALCDSAAGKQRDRLQGVLDSGRSLLTIIDEILDLSRIEAGALTLDPTPFRLADCLKGALKTIAVRALAKDLALRLHVEPGVPDGLVGDPGRVRQIMLNLIGNAVKFTDSGDVEVSARVTGRTGDAVHVQITVRDTGVGIPAAQLERIFEPFSQVDGSSVRLKGGTGLGLAISRRLAQLMGARLWAESEVDRGTRFHLAARFPLAPPPPATDAPIAAPMAAAGSPELRVLVAEDQALNRTVITHLLDKTACPYRVVANGREAVEAVEETGYDLILMDVQMPIMDGYEATRRIRELEGDRTEPTTILALTAHAMERDKESCLEAGMDGYLTKPLDFTLFFATLNQLADEKQARQVADACG
jgi:CheY-like chemotaxis protein